jgi:HSP20 family protein
MAITDLLPGKRSENVPARREEEPSMTALQREMNQLFDEFLTRSWGAPLSRFEGRFTPRVNVEERDDEIEITAELPGMEAEDVDLTLTDDALTISGEKREEKEEERGNYHYMERSYGSFRRSIPLPGAVDADEVDATFKNGVLTITMPKVAAKGQKKISVSSS